MSKNLQFLSFVKKKVVSLHLVTKSNELFQKCRKFQGITREVKFRKSADLLVCNSGNFLQPLERK